ncbi:MAG TPA: TonB-dependent receptor [Porphyromonadaceae bacterium]|nr:TonB-dependent receptor [Porphyromonadaceae bacterium]
MKISRLRPSAVILSALVAGAAAWAYNISGVVTDNYSEPLPGATVRVLATADSAFVKGGITDADGKYTIAGVNSGNYILEATYVGYDRATRNVRVSAANLRTDTLRLGEGSVMLKETTVIGVKTPIKVMQDTIEYNADTYKTQPNAVVEDLLKRLPGVEVDSDGKITANGKEVTKILIDGKEFFSDDPKVASKNLPVDMVDKLQVVDRKSDLARLTGVDDGEDETVINLTVKKGMQNGWFGTVEAGYGTDDRYKATFNVNRFWNGNQITFIGNANNTNELGFTDGNGSRFRRFGGDRGINNSQSFGVNFSVGKEERLRIGGDVMYSHTDRDTYTRQRRQYIFPDSASYENSYKEANDRGHNVRADFRVEWKPDSFNTFDFRPNFSYNQNDSRSWSADTLLAGSPGLPMVNRSYNRSSSHGTSWEAGGRLIYTHNFASHRGRSFSVMANYRMSNVREREDAFSHNIFYRLLNLAGTDSIDSYEQFTDSHTWSNSTMARLSWTEPLGDVKNGRFLTFAYQMRYNWNNADRSVDKALASFPDGPEYIDNVIFGPRQYVDSLSNSFRNNFFSQDIRVGFKQVRSTYNLDAGISLIPSMSKSTNLSHSERSIPERWVWNFAPFLRFRYKFSKVSSMMMFYRGRSSQPTMTQLQPVPDYTNPLNIVIGNPALNPSFNHHLMLRYNSFHTESQRSIMLMMDVDMTQNSIISRTDFNSTTGGRTTTYENVNGVWSGRIMNMFSQPFGHNKMWTFNNNIFVMYNRNVGYNNGLRNNSGSLMLAESPSLAFRPHSLELELRPFYRLNNTHNSLPNVPVTTIHNYGGGFNATWYAPLGIVLASDLNYTASKGYAEGFNENQWMWNASISYQFLRNQAATVQLKVYDILQQKQTVTRNITANYIDDTEYNTLTRYFMFSFTYRFNTFGKGNEPASRTFGRWGGPGGPGGPPPGMRH